ncbi:ribose 5-phosphate isomerase B [bacterium]|nr:MAG: ribose 5-phosphate isomerase B [bacterium]
MKLAIGADHAGFELKETLKGELQKMGHEVEDLGAHRYDALDDYPDSAEAVASAVAQGKAERGLVICGSGVGAAIAANKVKGARAAVAVESYSARQGVEHDDVNVLVLGGRVIGIEVAREALRAFLDAKFSGEERHVRRLNKVLDIERRGN